jgi:penicillin-binding protein 1B
MRTPLTLKLIFAAQLLSSISLADADWETLKSRALNQEFFDGQTVYALRDFISAKELTPSQWVPILERLKFRQISIEQPLKPNTFWAPSPNVCPFIKSQFQLDFVDQSCSVVSLDRLAPLIHPTLLGIVFPNEESSQEHLILKGNPLKPTSWFSTGFQSLFHLRDRTPLLFESVKLSDVPFACLQSILSTEDKKFLEHKGVDYKGIARAFIRNIQSGKLAQGGSTLTQQYVKNAFLSSEKTLWRKLTEARLSIWLESQLSKDEILERYLNVVYFGNIGQFEIRGIGAASQIYFDLPITQLSWPQCLVLASVLKGPNQFHPIKKTKALEARYRALLDGLIADQILKPEDKNTYSALPQVTLNLKSHTILNAASYLSAVSSLPQSGEVFLSLVPSLQNEIQKITFEYIQKTNPSLEASVVVVHRESGQVLSIINGKDPALSPYPRAVKSKRQIGSLIKPFIFYQHFLAYPKDSPQTEIMDEPLEFEVANKKWAPQNYDKKFLGKVSLEVALAQSLNIPAVKLGLNLPYKSWFPGQTHPSLLLGAIEMSPLEVALLYLQIDQGPSRGLFFEAPLNSFASSGVSKPMTELEKDARDKVWAILKTAAKIGTSKSLQFQPKLKDQAYGKTGTTSGFRDSWFAGFLDNYLIVVWVGADDNTNTKLTGSSGALPLFIEVANLIKSQALH